jgi:two-component system nitrogen regulation response regulator NtrX
MAQATVLMQTRDEGFHRAIQQAIVPIADLQVEVVANEETLADRLRCSNVVLLLAHVPDNSPTKPLCEILGSLKDEGRRIGTVVMFDHHRAADELELLQLGVADVLDRPLDLNRLAYAIDVLTVRARYAVRQGGEHVPSVESIGATEPFIYVSSSAAEQWMQRVKRVAPGDTTVLLTGETGTGKTRLARLIHELSSRHDQPFVTVHCGALSASLLESELFGHVKGAFTGAVRDRPGKFAEVGRGTLLLDDIDALPTDLQAKLLRVVEERVFEPVGSNRTLKMEARLIVASNRILEHEVAAGRLRTDLYYRLNVVGFHLIPLRERREVIAPLAYHFLRQLANRAGRSPHAISADALRTLQDYAWPGNIRELRNVIERSVALCPGPRIEHADLPEVVSKVSAKPAMDTEDPPVLLSAVAEGSLAETREEAEAQHIAAALTRHKNNRKRVAAELGISRMTLYKKLHRYGLMGAAG